MARIQQYSTDTTITGGDKLVGNDAADNSTKLFQISDIAAFFAKEGIADGGKIGYQFNYGGKYDNNTIASGNIEYDVNPTAPTQFTWANIDKIAVSTTSANSADISNVLPFMVNQNIKVTDILNDTVDNFAVFNVSAIADITGGKLLTVTLKASSGNPAAPNIVLAPFGFASPEDIGALTPDDIVNNLTSTDATKVLSAAQGKVLKDLIDVINTAIASDDPNLDTIQEIVDYIKNNASNISALQTGKVDKVTGKQLSEEDFTSNLLAKLNSIATNAEVNVQSDWAQSDSSNDAFIQNKPTDLTTLGTHSVTELNDVTNAGSGAIITSTERTKLTSVASGAEVNVQADYNESDSNSDAFIQNKPTITVAGTSNEVEVSPTGAQNLPTTFTVGLPNDVTITSDLTVGDNIELVNAQTSTPTFDNGFYHKLEGTADTLHFRYGGKDLSIDYLTEVLPTGILNGGELSVANTTQFTIAAGDGIINDLNKAAGSDPHPEIKKITWSQQTITVSNLDSGNTDQLNSWIYVDQNGAVQQQATAFTDTQKRNFIVIGSAIHSEGVLKFVRTFPVTAYSNANQLTEFVNIFGPLKKSGHRISANGANLSVNRAAGVAFALGRNYATDPENPSTVSDAAKTQAVIHRYYRNGSGGFILDDGPSGNGYTVLDPSKYDNGSGTLATVSGGHFTVQRLFYFPGTPNIIIAYYGHDNYSGLDTAEQNYNFEDFEEATNTAQQAIYLGAIIVAGNATALNNATQAKFLVAGQFRGLASVDIGGVATGAGINDLSDVTVSGLLNSQILQYNSTSGKWENQTISVSSSLAALTDVTITNPANGQVIQYNTSTSQWENVNGLSGTGAANKVAFWTGAGTLSNDSALHWDSANDRLGVGTSSSAYSLDVTGDIRASASMLIGTDLVHDGDSNTKIAFAADQITLTTGGVENVRIGPTEVAINETSDSALDFRVESNALSSALFVDASANAIGIGTSTPTRYGGITIQDSGIRFNNSYGYADLGQFYGHTMLTLSGAGNKFYVATGSSGPGGPSDSQLGTTLVGQLGVAETSPTVAIDAGNATDAIKIPNGTTAQRPTAAAGMLRYNTTDGQFEGYTTEWGPIGGGGGASTIQRDTFSGNGSTTQFTLSSSVSDEINTQVYIDGVYQSKLNYSTSGNVLTFSSAPPSGTNNIEVIHVTSVAVEGASALNKNTFTGDGSTTGFTLSAAPTSEDFTFVFIQGVYQEKSTYVVANNIITFSTAPQNGYTIEVMHINAVNVQQSSYMEYDGFTGTGSQTAFTLVNGNPTDEKFTMVFLQGVYQEKSTYSLANRTITFTTAPDLNYTIEVISINGGGLLTNPSTRPTVGVITANTTAVANSVYVLKASLTLTLPANPQIGDSVKVSNRSGTTTCVIGANNKKIMGAAANLTLDTASASFELIYSGVDEGWVIIGQ